MIVCVLVVVGPGIARFFVCCLFLSATVVIVLAWAFSFLEAVCVSCFAERRESTMLRKSNKLDAVAISSGCCVKAGSENFCGQILCRSVQEAGISALLPSGKTKVRYRCLFRYRHLKRFSCLPFSG